MPKPPREPLNKAEQKIADDAGGPHGGQGVRPQRSAHDHGVRQGVKQLKQISAHHRQRESQKRCKGPPLGQLLLHRSSSVKKADHSAHLFIPSPRAKEKRNIALI